MENQADKSQDATPYKLEEARKKGQVGKSAEFVSIASLIIMMMCLIFGAPLLGEVLVNNVSSWLGNAGELVRSPGLVSLYIKRFMMDVGSIVGLIFLAGAVSSIIFSILHAGPVFSVHPLLLDFSKLNPVNGIKKIFSKKGLFEITKLILKLVFIALGSIFVWSQIRDQVIHQNTFQLVDVIKNWFSSFIILLSCFLLILLFFALFDLWFSKKDFAKQMRMSTRDIKDEYKKREGDPEIKHKRKKGMQSLFRNIMSMSQIKNADVIITNPTHFAVALQYRSSSMPLPKVITKGRGVLAKTIIKNARRSGVPIIRSPLLARTIFKESEINSYIPSSEQLAIAKIYREIMHLPGSKVFD